MASPLVQKFRNDTAPRLLAKFNNGGVSVVLRTITPNADPLKQPTVSETSAPVNAVARGVAGQYAANDPNLIASDIIIIVAAIDFVPEVDGMVSVNGEDRRIVRVDPIPAAGMPAAYRFFVR